MGLGQYLKEKRKRESESLDPDKIDKDKIDTDKVQWDPTDTYPRNMAFFMKFVAGNAEQWRLLNEWEDVVEMREVITPVVKNGMLIKFNKHADYEQFKSKLILSHPELT